MLARVSVAFVVVCLAAGCVGPSADELHEAARSLVPPGSSIVEEVAADCVELARSPSCVHIYFVSATASRDARVAAVEKAAQAEGWEAVRSEAFVGGSQLRFRRGGLGASVFIPAEETASRCREAPAKDCADAVFVEAE